MDAHGIPVREIITSNTVADCTQAYTLLDGICAKHLLGDRGYDSNTIIELASKMEQSNLATLSNEIESCSIKKLSF